MACQAGTLKYLAPEGNRLNSQQTSLISPLLSSSSPPRRSPPLPPPRSGHRLCSSAVQQRRQRPMDQFPPDGYPVRLRSAVHGTYLHADKDGHGVSLSRRRASMKVAWVVHRYFGDDQHVLLHSAAYGRYLSATQASAPRDCPGFRVALRNYDELEDEAIRWQPFRVQPGAEILLCRHVAQGDRHGYLRANGKYLPWNGSIVSVHDVDNISTMMRWVVELVPSSERIPRLPRPSRLHLSVLLSSRSRMVVFTVNGEWCYAAAVNFSFRGRFVYHLRNELATRLGIPGNVSNNLVMYVRAGRYGRITPLVANLSHSTEILVITGDIPANGGPRHPDFDAE